MQKIAIIEDDTAINMLYKSKLALSGYDVQVAYDGSSGLKLIKDFQPELALVDIRMPRMNGDEMLQRVRQEEWGEDLKVIILTNLSKDEAPSMLRFLNIDRYVIKAHYTPTQVLAIVREVLGQTE
ncbi:MAG: hypothetical protein JWM37_511 [Candidatus Saccharibacteria bacterium]|nr:hypothetical protein [Candidatus Saccharibacteria bacterium]